MDAITIDDMELESGQDVLIVVDYQNDFVTGSLGFEKAKELDEGIAALVTEYIENDGIIIVTKDTHYGDYLDTQEGKNLPIEHCIVGTPGHDLYGETGKVVAENLNTRMITVIEKDTFPSLELGETLQDFNMIGNIKSIKIVGVVTNMCVIGNAVMAKAACPEAKITIVEDLVASNDEELHKRALDVMESMQMEISK